MTALLELKEVGKRFGGLEAVSGVSLAVEPREIRALIGPNGSGKSTCLNVISGLYKPTSGDVFYKGGSISGRAPHSLCQLGIARTFQNVRLFKEMTVLENVLVAAEIRSRRPLAACLVRSWGTLREEKVAREESMQALRTVGIEAEANVLAGSLPYGRQRVVEIARALASRPQLLLMDEPAAGLNSEETRVLTEKILELRASGMAILLVEHKMSMVMQISDRLTVLDFGRAIAEGVPDEIRENPAVIEAYLGRPTSSPEG